MSPVDLLALLVAFALVVGAAGLGARFRPGEWYRALAKPPWTPPDWLFAPVWTLLYAAMAVAAWWVWRHGVGAPRAIALVLWLAQLVANAAWSWLFFGRRRIGLALADIAALLVLVAATTAAFFRIAPFAGAMLLPYLLWVGFAAALNFSIGRRNRAASA